MKPLPRCVICGHPVDTDRTGAVATQVGTWAHDACARWLARMVDDHT